MKAKDPGASKAGVTAKVQATTTKAKRRTQKTLPQTGRSRILDDATDSKGCSDGKASSLPVRPSVREAPLIDSSSMGVKCSINVVTAARRWSVRSDCLLQRWSHVVSRKFSSPKGQHRLDNSGGKPLPFQALLRSQYIHKLEVKTHRNVSASPRRTRLPHASGWPKHKPRRRS